MYFTCQYLLYVNYNCIHVGRKIIENVCVTCNCYKTILLTLYDLFLLLTVRWFNKNVFFKDSTNEP